MELQPAAKGPRGREAMAQARGGLVFKGPNRKASLDYSPKVVVIPKGTAAIFETFARHLIGYGQGMQALCFLFSVTADRLLAEVVRLDLPTPPDKPFRVNTRSNAWTAVEVQTLMQLWTTTLNGSAIARHMGRSPGSVRGKAKSIGLPSRGRSGLTRELLFDAALPPVFRPETAIANRAYFGHTDHTDFFLGHAHLSGHHPLCVGNELGIDKHSVETRTSYLQLPRRTFMRGRLSMDYVPNTPHLPVFAAQDWNMYYCTVSEGRRYWSARGAQRIAKLSKKTKRYRDAVAALDTYGDIDGVEFGRED